MLCSTGKCCELHTQKCIFYHYFKHDQLTMAAFLNSFFKTYSNAGTIQMMKPVQKLHRIHHLYISSS